MTNRDWYDDSDYRSAVEQAERMTRVGWKTIGAVTGLLGIAVIGVVVACLAVVVAVAYAVVARY
jgi:tetrahydromethanopterin S-methyltransferase subunit G